MGRFVKNTIAMEKDNWINSGFKNHKLLSLFNRLKYVKKACICVRTVRGGGEFWKFGAFFPVRKVRWFDRKFLPWLVRFFRGEFSVTPFTKFKTEIFSTLMLQKRTPVKYPVESAQVRGRRRKRRRRRRACVRPCVRPGARAVRAHRGCVVRKTVLTRFFFRWPASVRKFQGHWTDSAK